MNLWKKALFYCLLLYFWKSTLHLWVLTDSPYWMKVFSIKKKRKSAIRLKFHLNLTLILKLRDLEILLQNFNWYLHLISLINDIKSLKLSFLSDIQRWATCIKKSILYAIYRYSRIFAQNMPHTYTLRILETVQYTLISKSIFNMLSEYTLKILITTVNINCIF